jgi:hypothetical protein
MQGHSTGSPACWLSALFQHLFWTFGASFDASDAEQPKVCCDQHVQQNRCYVPQVSVRRATHSFRDSNFRCRGWEAHHGGLTYAALGQMYVCASQKSLFGRQMFAPQRKSGGRKLPVASMHAIVIRSRMAHKRFWRYVSPVAPMPTTATTIRTHTVGGLPTNDARVCRCAICPPTAG